MTKMPPEKEINIDNILSELGNIGKFQLINFILIGIAILLSSIVSLTFVFAAGELNYRYLFVVFYVYFISLYFILFYFLHDNREAAQTT